MHNGSRGIGIRQHTSSYAEHARIQVDSYFGQRIRRDQYTSASVSIAEQREDSGGLISWITHQARHRRLHLHTHTHTHSLSLSPSHRLVTNQHSHRLVTNQDGARERKLLQVAMPVDNLLPPLLSIPTIVAIKHQVQHHHIPRQRLRNRLYTYIYMSTILTKPLGELSLTSAFPGSASAIAWEGGGGEA